MGLRAGDHSGGPATVARVSLARWRVPSRLKRQISGILEHLAATIRDEVSKLQVTLDDHHAQTLGAAQARQEHADRQHADVLSESRELYEWTEKNADRRLEGLAGQVLALHDQSSDQAGQRFDAIAAHLKELGDHDGLIVKTLSDIATRVEAVHQRVQATQALTALVYERGFGWEQQLNDMRLEADYELAFEEVEPLVTVRICTWNRAELLVDRALASLLRQTYSHWEAIVVGDACTDDTAERIAALGDSRISFENLEVRGPYPDVPEQMWQIAGTYGAQLALRRANGRWIAQLDDDDEWDDDHLEVLLADAVRSHSEVVYGKWRMVEATSRQPIGIFGSWPVEKAHITFQCAIEHGHLRRFLPDFNAYLADEPGDWHRVRRLLAAGVRFAFLDREVATVYYSAKTAAQEEFLDTMLPDRRTG
jgi:Glycosyl transferase family 2